MGKHEKYEPEGLILTNCEAEHLDHYGSEKSLFGSIQRFAKRVKSLVFCGEDPLLSQMKLIVVTDCICRKAKGLVEETCEKPMEVCFMFGSMGKFYLDNNPKCKLYYV